MIASRKREVYGNVSHPRPYYIIYARKKDGAIQSTNSLIFLCTCTQPLVVHKLPFLSMDIHYTVFCTCVWIMAKHKMVFLV